MTNSRNKTLVPASRVKSLMALVREQVCSRLKVG